jgi:hypothetical protein
MSKAKLVLQILYFSTILSEFCKPLDQEVKYLRIYFYTGPRKVLNPHSHALRTSTSVLGGFWLHNRTLWQRARLVGGEVGSGEVNKQGGSPIGLTHDRSVSVPWPEESPAMAGGETVAAQPPRLGFRRTVGRS